MHNRYIRENKSFPMRRILWAAILIPLLIVAVAGAIIASVTIGGNVKILNTSLVSSVPTTGINWGTLCLSCPTGQGFNNTSTRTFSLTNSGQVSLLLSYSPACTVGTLTLGEGNTSLNGVTLAAGQSISAVNATLFVSGTPVSNTYACGVTISGSA
jgi:hypothetical protein